MKGATKLVLSLRKYAVHAPAETSWYDGSLILTVVHHNVTVVVPAIVKVYHEYVHVPANRTFWWSIRNRRQQ